MLDIFPFLVWGATATSLVLFVVLWNIDELGVRRLAILGVWFAGAAWCQFFSGSPVWVAVGLGLQTLLAVYLLILWRLSG
jgi:hypothetical protein